MFFKNPANGYMVKAGGVGSFFLALCFGPLYFVAKGIWTHALISFVVAICTLGFGLLVYPFFAPAIVRHHYQVRGWRKVA